MRARRWKTVFEHHSVFENLELAMAGMKFNEVDLASFRDVLRRQGYYALARKKFGEQTWSIVQKATGVTT